MESNFFLEKIRFDENTGMSQKDIIDIEKKINFVYPAEYEELLMRFDGGHGNIGEFYIDFWGSDDILFYNEEFEELDDLILFASDGCGIAFAFKKGDKSIYSIPMDCLEKRYSKKIASNYTDFLQKIYNGTLKY